MKVGVVDIEVTDRMWFGHVWRRLQDALYWRFQEKSGKGGGRLK